MFSRALQHIFTASFCVFSIFGAFQSLATKHLLDNREDRTEVKRSCISIDNTQFKVDLNLLKRKLMTESVFAERYKRALESEFLFQPDLLDFFDLAQCCYNLRLRILSDEKIVECCLKVYQNPQLPLATQGPAVRILGMMRSENRADKITDVQAVTYLLDASSNPSLSEQEKDHATFALVWTFKNKFPERIHDEKIVGYCHKIRASIYLTDKAKDFVASILHGIRDSSVLSLWEKCNSDRHIGSRDKAAYGLILLYGNPELTNEHDYKFEKCCIQVFKSPWLLDENKNYAAHVLALMRRDDRTQSITDEEAVFYFRQTSIDFHKHPKERAEAAYSLVSMYVKRGMPHEYDRDAERCCIQAIQSPSLEPEDRAYAAGLLARMCFNGRTCKTEYNKVITYLELVTKTPTNGQYVQEARSLLNQAKMHPNYY